MVVEEKGGWLEAASSLSKTDCGEPPPSKERFGGARPEHTDWSSLTLHRDTPAVFCPPWKRLLQCDETLETARLKLAQILLTRQGAALVNMLSQRVTCPPIEVVYHHKDRHPNGCNVVVPEKAQVLFTICLSIRNTYTKFAYLIIQEHLRTRHRPLKP